MVGSQKSTVVKKKYISVQEAGRQIAEMSDIFEEYIRKQVGSSYLSK